MWTMITGFFSSTKNIIMAVGGALLFGYVATQKYKAYKAEDELKTIETKIAKTNVVVAKQKAKAKAQAKEIETTTEVEILRELKKEEKRVLKEMDIIEKEIVETQKEKVAVKGRKRGKKIKVEV